MSAATSSARCPIAAGRLLSVDSRGAFSDGRATERTLARHRISASSRETRRDGYVESPRANVGCCRPCRPVDAQPVKQGQRRFGDRAWLPLFLKRRRARGRFSSLSFSAFAPAISIESRRRPRSQNMAENVKGAQTQFHVARSYSWMRPPSRSRRSIADGWSARTAWTLGSDGSGGARLSEWCGLWVL
jgi:hypothetical protein